MWYAELNGSEIRPPFRCDYGYQTFVGARTFANFGLISLDVATVRIGDDVQIGPNVQLLAALHPVAAGPRRDKWEAVRPITIGDNVWLGGGVIVLPGVTIGANTVDSRFFVGAVDEVRIWSTVRSAGDITSTMHQRLVGNETGLVAYWRFDEPGATTLADSSPNNATASVFGNPQWVASDAPVCPKR